MTHSLSPPGRILLSQTISVNAEATFLLDAQCHVLSSNTAAQVLLGYSAHLLFGQDVTTWIHPDDLSTLKSTFLCNSMMGAVGSVRLRVRQASDEWVWVSATSVSFLNDPNVQAIVLHLHPEQRFQEKHQRALWEIAQVLNSTYQMPEVIDAVLRQGLQFMGAGAGSINLISADALYRAGCTVVR